MTTKTKAILAVIIGNGIFGFSFLFSKLALQITIPSVLIAVRFLVAFFVLNIIVILGKGRKSFSFSLKGKSPKNVLLLALFQPVMYFIAENYGIVYTSSAFAGVIIAVIPIAGLIFDVWLMHAKVSRKQILCSVGSVLGVVITTIGAQNMESSLKGLALLLIAVIAGAMFYVFSKKSADEYNPLERTYVMFGVGSLVYMILALVQCYGRYDEYIVTAVTSRTFWIAILYLAVVSSVIAFLLLNFGTNHVSVSQASLFANFTTVISILAGVLVLKEAFSVAQVVGALVIIISVYVASVTEKT